MELGRPGRLNVPWCTLSHWTHAARGRKLVEVMFWMILGLGFQSLCVYMIADPVLHRLPDLAERRAPLEREVQFD